ncbi:hypothetical protein ACP88_09040, partial [Pseudomonas oleovorans]|nr:hypothetical protein [Pseudomonas oleovorans]
IMTELHGKIGSPASGIRRGQLKMGSMERIRTGAERRQLKAGLMGRFQERGYATRRAKRGGLR